MTEKDKRTADTLRRSFGTHPEHEKTLHGRIMSQLPERDNKKIIFIILHTLFSCGVLLMLLLKSRTICNIIENGIEFIRERQIPDSNSLLELVLCIATIAVIIWQICNLFYEYSESENENMIKRAAK